MLRNVGARAVRGGVASTRSKERLIRSYAAPGRDGVSANQTCGLPVAYPGLELQRCTATEVQAESRQNWPDLIAEGFRSGLGVRTP